MIFNAHIWSPGQLPYTTDLPHPHIPVDELCLLYRDKKLEDWARVKDYNIVDGDKMALCALALCDIMLRYRLPDGRDARSMHMYGDGCPVRKP